MSSNGQIRLGLQRIKSLLAALEQPHLQFPVIQVAGTNGKGTTGAYLDQLLRHALATSEDTAPPAVGRFNSPHLLEQRDSAVVNGEPIAPSVWAAAGEKVAEAARTLDASPFERLFARAMLSFSLLPPEFKPQVLVLEAGLGFQDDATNVFPPAHVLAGVLTQVALDHTALLGDTLQAITRNKADVFPANGLGIVVDQRRRGEGGYGSSASDERAKHSASALPANPVAGIGEQEFAVLSTTREKALEKDVRLARAFVPSFASGNDLSFSAVPGAEGWVQPLAHVHVQYNPTLFPTSGLAGTGYSARRGEPSVPGPNLLVPATAAHVAGLTAALQTLWSIARDEPASAASGGPGTDRYEHIRMQIAMFLGLPGAEDRVAHAVRSVEWLGRAHWATLPVHKEQPHECQPRLAPELSLEPAQDRAEEQLSGVPMAAPSLTHLPILIDGAHNPASASALRSYLSLCLGRARQPVRVTYVMGFTAGKDVGGMLSTLLGPTDLADAVGGMSLDEKVVHRVAFVPFSTPEGMDWIQPVLPAEAQDALRITPGVVLESETFPSLREALRWAAEDHVELNADGDAVGVVPSRKLAVVCGSLYVVSDLYRLLQAE